MYRGGAGADHEYFALAHTMDGVPGDALALFGKQLVALRDRRFTVHGPHRTAVSSVQYAPAGQFVEIATDGFGRDTVGARHIPNPQGRGLSQFAQDLLLTVFFSLRHERWLLSLKSLMPLIYLHAEGKQTGCLPCRLDYPFRRPITFASRSRKKSASSRLKHSGGRIFRLLPKRPAAPISTPSSFR